MARLAEVQYMLAECKWRDGDKGEAARLINDVRKRNFENEADPDPCTAANLDEWRMLVEWGIEFLGERPPPYRPAALGTSSWKPTGGITRPPIIPISRSSRFPTTRSAATRLSSRIPVTDSNG